MYLESRVFKALICVLCIGTANVRNMYSIWGKINILNEARRPDQVSSILASLFVSLVSLVIKEE